MVVVVTWINQYSTQQFCCYIEEYRFSYECSSHFQKLVSFFHTKRYSASSENSNNARILLFILGDSTTTVTTETVTKSSMHSVVCLYLCSVHRTPGHVPANCIVLSINQVVCYWQMLTTFYQTDNTPTKCQ